MLIYSDIYNIHKHIGIYNIVHLSYNESSGIFIVVEWRWQGVTVGVIVAEISCQNPFVAYGQRNNRSYLTNMKYESKYEATNYEPNRAEEPITSSIQISCWPRYFKGRSKNHYPWILEMKWLIIFFLSQIFVVLYWAVEL